MLHVNLYVLAALLQLSHSHDNGDVFSSNVHIENALRDENTMAMLLWDFVDQENETLQEQDSYVEGQPGDLARLVTLRSLANFHLHQSQLALENVDSFVRNPINSFLFMKRNSLDWERRVNLTSKSKKNLLLDKITKIRKRLPSAEDLKGAVLSINRLQDFYLLNLSDVADGHLKGVNSPKLSIDDCFTLGRISFENGDAHHSGMWMAAALEKIDNLSKYPQNEDNFEKETEITKTDFETIQILDYLLQSYFALGNITKVIPLLDRIIAIDSTNEKAKHNKNYLLQAIKDPTANSKLFRTMPTLPEFNLNRHGYRTYEDFLTYTALCRGETPTNASKILKVQHQLGCRLVHGKPQLLLHPLKLETLSLSPEIVLFHDFVTEAEMDHLRDLGAASIGSQQADGKLRYYISKNVRIVKNAWLYDRDSQIVERINRRIEVSTGLSMETAEPLQMANYGMGGHYVPHVDSVNPDNEKTGPMVTGKRDRTATFMIYLSDVTLGGATVFLNAHQAIQPQRGAAAFWYNTHASGTVDYRTWHAACPVLLGNKWVANKWIHESGQEFHRPCSLQPDE